MEPRKSNAGRPRDTLRKLYMDRYDIDSRQAKFLLSDKQLEQLEACKDDATRRILLGKSK